MKKPFLLLLIPMAVIAAAVVMKTSDYPNLAVPANSDLFLIARPGVTNFNITWLQMHSNQTFYGTTTFEGDTNSTGNIWEGDQFFQNGNVILSNAWFVGPIDATNVVGLPGTYGYDTNQNIETPDLGDLTLLVRPGDTNYNITWLQAHSNQTFYGTTTFAGGGTNTGPNIFAGDQFFYDGNITLSNGYFVGPINASNIVGSSAGPTYGSNVIGSVLEASHATNADMATLVSTSPLTNAVYGSNIVGQVADAFNSANADSATYAINVLYTTNIGSTTIDFGSLSRYAGFSTNAAFNWAGFINKSAEKPQSMSRGVTNSSGSTFAVGVPANCHLQGTSFVTNVTMFSFWYDPLWNYTNCIAYPLF
jgi:3-phenylpropionate/cinnamic acid dioxygenase small subunit